MADGDQKRQEFLTALRPVMEELRKELYPTRCAFVDDGGFQCENNGFKRFKTKQELLFVLCEDHVKQCLKEVQTIQ